MRLRSREHSTTTDERTDVAWDGVPSRPAAPPVIRAPKAADLATKKAA